ncbi:unnamed protein product, partial [Schistosoma rodhaini]
MVKEAGGWERRGFVFEVEGLGVEVGTNRLLKFVTSGIMCGGSVLMCFVTF